jgi:hypothetical protein
MDVPDAEWSRFRENQIGLRGPEGDAENLPFTRAALAMMENLDANVRRVLAGRGTPHGAAPLGRQCGAD